MTDIYKRAAGFTLGDILAEAMKPKLFKVGVKFLQPYYVTKWRTRHKIYSYLTDIPNIKVGDTVVVDSPTSGYTCVKVATILEYHPDSGGVKPLKWIVDVVRDTGYQCKQVRAKRMAELTKALDTLVASAKQKITWDTLADDSPYAYSLLSEYRRWKNQE